MQSEDLPRMTTLSPELNYPSEKKFQLSRQVSKNNLLNDFFFHNNNLCLQ